MARGSEKPKYLHTLAYTNQRNLDALAKIQDPY